MLYIVATPIGNLQDISDRAKQTLREANLIIAENPSYSRRLLEHFHSPGKKFAQFADHNEQRMLPVLLEHLKSADAVLISDAGTPGVSDPGFRLVRAAIAAGIQVVPIPGPSAAITALSASGLPTDRFIFFGFMPKTEIKLLRELQKAQDLEATAIFYESPQRILKTAQWIAKSWPDSNLVVARELTKMHEEFTRGKADAVAENLAKRAGIKGELTVLLSFK